MEHRRIVELYRAEEMHVLQRRVRFWRIVTAAVALLTLAGCAALCVHVTPANARRMLSATILISIVGGWIVLTLVHFVLVQVKQRLRHTEAMLAAVGEPIEGTFTLTDERIHIKNGISMRRLAVEHAGRSSSLQVYDKKAPLLEGVPIKRVYVSEGFLIAFEVSDATD